MKKIILVFVFITLPLIANSQLTGDGTYGNPWSGTLSGDATWSGTKYINGDIIIDNEILTISEGTIIVFLEEGADLIITGTGQLDADGTSSNMIRFTADDDDDSNYGENGERWGHISFQSMGSAGSSIINNCILEYGYNYTGTYEIPSMGGAIYAGFTDLVISNCIVRNNYAGWGGGIAIGSYISPIVDNCYIHNNKSWSSGGGLFVTTGSAALIKNCLVTDNRSEVVGGGGGVLLGANCGAVRIINTVFASNSAKTSGQNVNLHGNLQTENPSFVNSIIWGSSSSIVYTGGQPRRASDFVNCAIQNPVSGSTTNCVSLNSLNEGTNPPGPFFTDPGEDDYSIKFISPCRDAGTIPSPAVPTDYLGNPRIGPYDIGAYEAQYNRWNGSLSTEWSSPANWDGGVPDNSRDIIIIPTALSVYPVSASNPDFTLGSGKQMIIEPGARVTLNNLTNNGTLKLNHDASGFASLILDGYTRGAGGSEEIQLYLSGGGSEFLEDYKWHYISTPVTSISTDLFTETTLNLAHFVESRVSTDIMQGWIAFDGYPYSGGEPGPPFNTLTPGIGYDYFDEINATYTFDGLFNTSNVVMPLDYSGVPATVHGFNLLGNPFSSGLNWDDIIDEVYAEYPGNTSKGLYFTRDNIQCTYAAGVGVPGDVTGIIPPMQGFFTKTYSTGNSITIPAASRTHDNIHPRYKGKNVIPLVRLAIFEDVVSNDETVVRFDIAAKSELDNDFDALKLFLSPTKTTIHTTLGGVNYSINGLPFPETTVEIPVVVNMVSNSVHKISTTQLQGLDNYYVYLIDKSTGFTADLKTTPDVTFSAPAGLVSNRFILKITNIMSGNEDPAGSANDFNIYSGFNLINIQTLSDDWNGNTGSVKLLNMSGKTISDLQNTEFNRDAVIQMQAPKSSGLYFVEIRSGLRRYVGKVVIK